MQGISFEQYSDFCQLLNSLEDFSIAMTMYTIAGQPVSEEEFERAAHICLGKPLDSNLVSTVFEIFDKDGEKLVCVCWYMYKLLCLPVCLFVCLCLCLFVCL